jgi:hypothetical protein
MKVTKYLVIALAVVAILASIAWYLRNTIIHRLSGPILQEYGVTVTDVSLDALATSNAAIGYLELEHENGTTIAIDELTLPIGRSQTGIKTFTAEKVTIDVSSASDTEPLALALAAAKPVEHCGRHRTGQHGALPFGARHAGDRDGE